MERADGICSFEGCAEGHKEAGGAFRRSAAGGWRREKSCVSRQETERDGREQRERDGQSVRVRTLRSTDCGVAFLVSLEEGQIYHAGDLNCWTWPEDTKQHRNQMVAEYQREIRRLQGEQIRLAFCPLDPRLEENYADGFLWFLSMWTQITCGPCTCGRSTARRIVCWLPWKMKP